jgi:hypothetical protein
LLDQSQLSATTKVRVYSITKFGSRFLLNEGTHYRASFPVDREHISSTDINQDQLTFDWV